MTHIKIDFKEINLKEKTQMDFEVWILWKKTIRDYKVIDFKVMDFTVMDFTKMVFKEMEFKGTN